MLGILTHVSYPLKLPICHMAHNRCRNAKPSKGLELTNAKLKNNHNQVMLLTKLRLKRVEYFIYVHPNPAHSVSCANNEDNIVYASILFLHYTP